MGSTQHQAPGTVSLYSHVSIPAISCLTGDFNSKRLDVGFQGQRDIERLVL